MAGNGRTPQSIAWGIENIALDGDIALDWQQLPEGLLTLGQLVEITSVKTAEEA